MFMYSLCGKCPFPPLQWSFPHTATFTSFPTPVCWVGAGTPAFSGLFIYSSIRDCPPHPSALRTPCPLCYVSFLLLLFIIQFGFFLFFPWVGVSLSRGYADLAQGCLWEYCVPLSSPGGLRLPKQSGSWHLVAQEPSWFLHLM
jgi:hypothetical protein